MSEQQKVSNDQPKVPASALNPETQAYMNSAIASAVSEALKGAMALMGPIIQSVALTPEKIQELKKPYEDPARAARDLRDRRQFKAQVDEMARNEAAKKAACFHRHPTGMEAIQVVHNFPDRQPRGTCSICGDWIFPKEWRIGPADEQHPAGKPYVVKPHKDYLRVVAVENGSSMPINSMTPVTTVGQM